MCIYVSSAYDCGKVKVTRRLIMLRDCDIFHSCGNNLIHDKKTTVSKLRPHNNSV